MDAAQVQEGLTTAQTVMTVLGSMGAFEGAKWLGEWWQKRRDAKLAEKAADVKAEQDAQTADHQQAMEMRKYRIAEYDAIIAQKDADILQRDEAYKAYQKFAHDRLDVAAARILDLHAEKIATAAQMARIEERLKACEDDRQELRIELAKANERIEKLEAEREA